MKDAFQILLLILLQISFCKCEAKITNQASQEKLTTSKKDTVRFPIYQRYEDFEPLLQHINDTTYVINFWATWCKPCIVELPFFEKLHKENYNKSVKVVLVSMDFPKQIKTKLIPFLEENEIQAQVVALLDMDYNSWIDKVSHEWDGAIPFTLIYNKDKRLAKSGELENYKELNDLLSSVISN